MPDEHGKGKPRLRTIPLTSQQGKVNEGRSQDKRDNSVQNRLKLEAGDYNSHRSQIGRFRKKRLKFEETMQSWKELCKQTRPDKDYVEIAFDVEIACRKRAVCSVGRLQQLRRVCEHDSRSYKNVRYLKIIALIVFSISNGMEFILQNTYSLNMVRNSSMVKELISSIRYQLRTNRYWFWISPNLKTLQIE